MAERRVAVDTSVFVNVLTSGARDDSEWLKFSKRVLARGLAGDFRIVLPTIVIAEVAGCGDMRGSHLEANVRRQRIAVVREWIDKSRFLEVELDGHTARLAAELAIEHQLKGADASILACAVAAKCETLYTWDEGLTKVDDLAGLRVFKPSSMDAIDLVEASEDHEPLAGDAE